MAFDAHAPGTLPTNGESRKQPTEPKQLAPTSMPSFAGPGNRPLQRTLTQSYRSIPPENKPHQFAALSRVPGLRKPPSTSASPTNSDLAPAFRRSGWLRPAPRLHFGLEPMSKWPQGRTRAPG